MTDLTKERTRVAITPASTAVLVGGCVVVAVVLGLVLDPVAGWAADQRWLPAGVVVDQVDRFAGWAAAWAQALVGAAVGVAVGLVLVSQATVVEVDGREVVVRQGGKWRRFARAQVGAVVLERRHVSVRDHDDVEVVRESVDGDVATLRTALTRHGWPVQG